MAARALTLVWFVATLALLSWPVQDLPDVPVPAIDKLVHVALFAVGAIVALRGWPDRPLLVVGLLLSFAALSEIWQGMIPTGRQASVLDVLANTLGIAVGWGIVRRLDDPRRNDV